MIRAQYSVFRVSPQAVFIVDEDGPMSITNDAEGVTAEIHNAYPGRRIIYRDTLGNWDELVHLNGVFASFSMGHQGLEIPQ